MEHGTGQSMQNAGEVAEVVFPSMYKPNVARQQSRIDPSVHESSVERPWSDPTGMSYFT
jgi:hypothetical protein